MIAARFGCPDRLRRRGASPVAHLASAWVEIIIPLDYKFMFGQKSSDRRQPEDGEPEASETVLSAGRTHRQTVSAAANSSDASSPRTASPRN